MKKVLRFLTLAAMLCIPWVTQAQATLTVYDGSATSSNVPVHGTWADAYLKCEFVIPATALDEMNGGTISEMMFYLTTPASAAWTGTFQVFLKEVGSATISAFSGTTDATIVYEGTLDGTQSTMTIPFSNNYVYGGDNLLVGVYQIVKGNYKSATFAGETVTGASVQGYDANALASVGPTQKNFIPKTTFTYTAGSCEKPATLDVSSVTATGATFTWTAGSGTYNVEYKTAAAADWTSLLTNTTATSHTLTGLTPATDYRVRVQSVCGGETSGWKTANFTTECSVINTFPWSENFDSYSGVTGGTTNNLPRCWHYINTCTYSSYKGYPVIYNSSSYSHSGNNHLRFYSYYYSTSPSYDPQDQYAILPEMVNISGLRMKLYARANSTYAYYDATFHVGVMTDPTDASTFTEIGSYTPSSTTYEQYTIPFSSYAGLGRYIAIMIEAADDEIGTTYYSYRSVYIDDITVEEIPTCLEPSALEVTGTTTTSATLNWTPGSDETAWDIYYSTSNVAPTDGTSPSETANTRPFTVNGLHDATAYYVWVRAHCGDADGQQSPWVGGIHFATKCEPNTVFPWSENFESYASGNFAEICWENEHISGDGTQIFKVYTSTNGDNSTHQLQLPDQSGGTLTKLMLPGMTLPGNNYQFTLDVYRSSSTYNENYPSEGIRVYVSTDGEIAGATELAFIPRHYAVSNSTIPAETAVGWYTYELPIGISGTCYIILRGESQYCAATYMDNFVVEQIPTCAKPSGLMLSTPSSKTAHTATLSWTNGGTETEWEIAYSTESAFDPNSVTPVAVTTKPYTLTGLNASTTYYAYVRANCGGGDYSAWCSTKYTFTTTSGTQAPTGLAATPESPYAATVTWTGVATNDNHASYDLFYSQNSTPSPNNETVPSFTDIDTESKLIAGLTPATTYYVWVRDHCGADGNSSWTGYVSFTTPEFCPAPTGVTVSSATAHGATISWTGTSDSYKVMVGEIGLTSEDYDFEGGDISHDFTNSATHAWTVTTDDKHAGTYAVKSAGGFTSTQSDLTLTVSVGDGATITFWDKASSENTDYGRFLIDGVQMHQTSGTSGSWTERTYPLTAGSHTLVWRYYKDYSVNSGEDCYYVDDITITNLIDVASWETYNAAESPYVLNDDGNIRPEADYAVKVVGVCGGEVSAHESAVVPFTTVADCSAANVTVDNIGFHGADITWDGSSDAGFTVMLGEENGNVDHEFANEDFSGGVPGGWTNDATYPWTVVNGHLQSGNAGVASSTSMITFTADFDAPGYVEFTAECRGEGTSYLWDKCIFTIDETDMFTHGADLTDAGFVQYSFPVAAGTHTFKWKYTKDSSQDPDGDYFAIDNVRIFTADVDWNDVETVDVTHYSFDGLEDGTKYYVKVSPECDRAIESDVAEFTTLALPTISVVANSWYALSSPMHDAGQNYESISHISSNIITGTYDFLRYNESTSTWESQKSGAGHTGFTRLEQGRGYIYRRANDAVLKVDGEPNTGNVNVAITKDVDGWNLIGNPFMVPIRFNSTYMVAASTAALNTSGFYTLSTNGTWTAVSSYYFSSTDIAAGQAVLVKANTAGTLTLRPSASKGASAAEEESDKGIVFSVSNDKFTDVAYAMFADGEGLPKIAHLNPEAPALSIGGYAVATLDENTERFPMSVSGQGRYTLALKENSAATGYLHLIDRATGSDIDLLATPEYSFVANGMADRFEVRLMPGMDENGNVTFVRIDGSRLIVDGEGELQVFDVMGRQLGSAQVSGTTTLDRSSLGIVSAGVYVMRLDGNSQKIVVK